MGSVTHQVAKWHLRFKCECFLFLHGSYPRSSGTSTHLVLWKFPPCKHQMASMLQEWFASHSRFSFECKVYSSCDVERSPTQGPKKHLCLKCPMQSIIHRGDSTLKQLHASASMGCATIQVNRHHLRFNFSIASILHKVIHFQVGCSFI